MSAKNFLGLKNFKKILSNHKFFFISSPKYIELNSEFFRTKKTWVFWVWVWVQTQNKESDGSKVIRG